MPNTYVALDKITVTTATPSITFTGISGAYTDLVLVVSARSTYAAAEVAGFIRLGNGSIDTGSNYSRTRLLGTGSAASSARASNLTATPWDAIPGSTSASGNFCTTIISIQNYSNTTTYKTFLIRANEPNNYVEAEVGLWRGMSAINQVQIYGDGGGDLAVGSTFSLYGIANADQGAAKATGGIITEDSQYWYHTFGASGTFTPKQALTCDYLVVAGGGGGAGYAGGGGAGGYLTTVAPAGGGGSVASPASLSSGVNYTVTIGAGGASVGSGLPTTNGNNGVASTISGSGLTTISATGGGGGGAENGTGNSGGSGGGGGTGNNAAGTGTTNQGYGGGLSPVGGGGGGGGAGGVGSSSTTGNGGVGLTSTIFNTVGIGQFVSGSYYLAGGGGSPNVSGSGGAGGVGGGGNGGLIANPGTAGSTGTTNTGGGGGGGGFLNTSPYTARGGGAGGSGIVVIRYPK